MVWLRRLVQGVGWTALFLGVSTAVFFTIATLLARTPLNTPYQPSPEATIPIYVLSNGVHTDLILPIIVGDAPDILWDWSTFIPFEQFDPLPDPTVGYIGFGWGEQRLYRDVPEWSDLTVEITLNAMMWPSRSAMHVYLLPAAPPEHSHLVRLMVDETQYRALIDHIQSSFSLTTNGEIINLNCCWYPRFNDNFYESPHWYHFLQTCNVWTNNALKAANLPTGRWALFDTDIMRHVRE